MTGNYLRKIIADVVTGIDAGGREFAFIDIQPDEDSQDLARALGIEPTGLFHIYPDSARIRRPPLPNGAIRILPNG